MAENRIFNLWTSYKATTSSFYQLRGPSNQSAEFRGPRMGHPSNYAFVEFQCHPSPRLVFASAAIWPTYLEQGYRAKLEEAICYGIVDALMAEEFYPHRGCALTLVEVGWDDVSSSEIAFYKAAKLAMQHLIESGDWALCYPGKELFPS